MLSIPSSTSAGNLYHNFADSARYRTDIALITVFRSDYRNCFSPSRISSTSAATS